jgi:cutinase
MDQYPANLDILNSQAIGVDDAVNRLNKQNKECPDQKFAIVGYSQGAGVMHDAVNIIQRPDTAKLKNRPKLDESVVPKILAAVMFGDPGFKGTMGPTGFSPPFSAALMPKLKQNCAYGDPV